MATGREAVARPRANLRALGYTSVPGKARRMLTPDGEEVSYRDAYKRATGLSLEQAVRRPGKFSPEFHDAKQVRAAARRGDLARDGLMSAEDEKALASTWLRTLVKDHPAVGPGHGRVTRMGLAAAGVERAGPSVEDGWARVRPPDPSLGPERASVYGRLLGLLRTDTVKPNSDDYPSGPEGDRLYREAYDAWYTENGPRSAKAKLLVAMGRRPPEAEYAVGETP